DVKHPQMLGAPNNAYGSGTVIFPGNEILVPDVPFEFTKAETDAARKYNGLFNVSVEICVSYEAPDAPDKHASGTTYLAVFRDPQGGASKSFSALTEQPIEAGLLGFAPVLPTTYGD